MTRLSILAAIVITGACVSPPPPAPSVTPAPVRPNVVEGVAVYPMGDLHGDVALVLRAKPGNLNYVQIGEIWAVPLDGTDPRLLVRYPSPFIGAGFAHMGWAVLARQLSPDARRLVLTVGFPNGPGAYEERLVVVDLLTSDARTITTAVSSAPTDSYDLRPAWSRDGDLIAFEKMEATFLTGVWLVRPDGSDLRKVCSAGSGADARGMGFFYGCGGVVGWTPDGRLGFAEVDGYSLIDRGGRIDKLGYRLSSVQAVDWRATQPRLVATTGKGIVTTDEHGGNERILVGPGTFPQQFEPRWRPNGEDILVREGVAPASKLVVLGPSAPVELATGVARADARCASRAEWSPDGSKIVYLSDCVTDPFLVRLIDVAGTVSARAPDRLLTQLPDGRAGWRPVDLVVVRYP